MAKDAYWFRHDANARNDIKMIELRSLHGFEGYGIYFAILEVMREQAHYAIPENKIGMVGVALGEPSQKVASMIEDCISVGLFVREDGLIYSPSFINRMSKWEDAKTRNETNGAKGGRPKANPSNNPKHNPSDNPNETQNKPSRGEESIEEEKRYKEARKRFVAPTLDEVREEMGNDIEAERFFDYYKSNGWKVSKNPMVDWKASIRNWKRNKMVFNTKGEISNQAVVARAPKPIQVDSNGRRIYGDE